ncbi:MAG: hypothetical protein ABIG87_02935 [Patescibacteria group bacterium]
MTVSQLYDVLKGKTIEWDITYEPKSGLYSGEVVNMKGAYTFPTEQYPGDNNLQFAGSTDTLVDGYSGYIIEIFSGYIIEIFPGNIRIKYTSANISTGYQVSADTTAWDGTKWRENTYAFLNEGVGSFSNSFFFWSSLVDDNTYNFKFSLNYNDEEQGWLGVNNYYDRYDYENLLVIQNGSYIKITESQAGVLPSPDILDPDILEGEEKINIEEEYSETGDILSSDRPVGLKAPKSYFYAKAGYENILSKKTYFDTDDNILYTDFYLLDGVTKSKKIEYFSNGEINKQIFYAEDGTVTNINVYHTNGMINKKITNRGGVETYSRYNENGKIVYSHIYNNNTYKFEESRSYDYDNSGNILEVVNYRQDNNYNKDKYYYALNGVLNKTESFVRIPRAGTARDYIYTITEFADGQISQTTKKYYDLSDLTHHLTEINKYDNGAITNKKNYDFINNKYAVDLYGSAGDFSATERKVSQGKINKTYLFNNATGEYLFTTIYYYNEDGTLKIRTESNLSFTHNGEAFSRAFSYFPNSTDVDEEKEITYYSSDFKHQFLTTKYDYEGEILYKNVITFDDTVANLSNAYDTYGGGGRKVSSCDYNQNNGWLRKCEYFDWIGETYAENEYAGLVENDGVDKFYRVFEGQRLLGSSIKSFTTDDPLYENKLVLKDIGNLILASIGINIDTVNVNNEKDNILKTVKALMSQYKDKLTGLTDSEDDLAKKYDIYANMATKISYAIRAIEYKVWGVAKGIIKDSKLEDTATTWEGKDKKTGEDFFGMYIVPMGVDGRIGSATSIFIDMKTDAGINSAINASSYNELLAFDKKLEKWDATYCCHATIYNGTTGELYKYDPMANNGAGGYLSVREFTKADPSVVLLIDRMFEDLKKEGIDLYTLGEKDVINEYYKYFFKKKLMSYMADTAEATLTAGEILNRGGGDCDDYAALGLATLRQTFNKIGNEDAVKRLAYVGVRLDDYNPITSANSGTAGHAGFGYTDTSGVKYYLESASLFNGSGQIDDLDEYEMITSLSPNDEKALTGRVSKTLANWYVKVIEWSNLNGQTFYANGTLLSKALAESDNEVGVNGSDKISGINKYIEPYNEKIMTLGTYLLPLIPNMAGQSAEFVAEYIHNYIYGISQYTADVSGDNWATVGETLAPLFDAGGNIVNGTIKGDCEDLAFVEASLLQNVLAKFYAMRGVAPIEAVKKAESNVIILAEKDYGGQIGRSHIITGFVVPTENTEYSLVKLMDPQVERASKIINFSEILKSKKYSFFANTKKVTAITFEHWGEMEFSSAVSTSWWDTLVSLVWPATEKPQPEVSATSVVQTATSYKEVEENVTTLDIENVSLKETEGDLKINFDRTQEISDIYENDKISLSISKDIQLKEEKKQLELEAVALQSSLYIQKEKLTIAQQKTLGAATVYTNTQAGDMTPSYVVTFWNDLKTAFGVKAVYTMDVYEDLANAEWTAKYINESLSQEQIDAGITYSAKVVTYQDSSIPFAGLFGADTKPVVEIVKSEPSEPSFSEISPSSSNVGYQFPVFPVYVPKIKNGGWTDWNCSSCVTKSIDGVIVCGKTCFRTCTNPTPQNGGASCGDTDMETEERLCDDSFCRKTSVIDGGWTDWNCSSCSVSCGGTGAQTCFRTCTNPTPADGGAECVGQSTKTQSCYNECYIPPEPKPAMCGNLCDSLPEGTRLTEKPANSYFVGEKNCSSNSFGVCNDVLYYTGWMCNDGYLELGEVCYKIFVIDDFVLPDLSISLTAVPSYINQTYSTELFWSVENSTADTICTASNDKGLTGWNGTVNNTEGSIIVTNITEETTFTLVCERGSDLNTDTKFVKVPMVPPYFDLVSDSNKTTMVKILDKKITSSEILLTVSPNLMFSDNVFFSVSIDPNIDDIVYKFSNPSLSSADYTKGTKFSIELPSEAPIGSYKITIMGCDMTTGLICSSEIISLNATDRIVPVFEEI